MRLNDEELELVSMARGQNIDEMVAVVEHIVAARVAEALAPIEALAEEWESLGSRNANAFDYGRWHPAAAKQLRAAIASHYEGVSR